MASARVCTSPESNMSGEQHGRGQCGPCRLLQLVSFDGGWQQYNLYLCLRATW